MMISPDSYRMEHQNDTLEELQAEARELRAYIHNYECGLIPKEDLSMLPSPSTICMMYREYLKVAKELIREKR